MDVCTRHDEETPCVFCMLLRAHELLAGVAQNAADLEAISAFLLPGSINKIPPLLAPGEMNFVMLRLGPKLFEFYSFDDWVSRARHLYARIGQSSETTVAIDQFGRICDGGADMRRAQESAAYPINVYSRNLTVT